VVMRRGRVELDLSGEEARQRIGDVEQAYLTSGGSSESRGSKPPPAGNTHGPAGS
jgi:hypothetical protein